MADNKRLTVSCHCGAATHTFSVPTSSLPLPTHLCNCDCSRRISGSLLTSYINITHDPAAPKPDVSALSKYPSSAILNRYFCSACGTQMYLEYHKDGHFEAATGTLQVESTDGIIKFEDLMWLGDTKDGGASQFIDSIDARPLDRYLQNSWESNQVPWDWKEASTANDTSPSSSIKKSGSVYAHCRCKGVEFYISPPNSSSQSATSAYPDLLIPYHSGSSDNPSNETWWLPSPSHDRYLAGTCTCNSCRRMSGFDITFWAFIPTANISLDSSLQTPFRKSPYWGTMKMYRSSEGVTRTFCSVCGANVFWDGRETMVDVAVGLLDAESGARAEEILAWWPGRVSFREEALNKGLVRGLEEGLKVWAEKNNGADWVAQWTGPKR